MLVQIDMVDETKIFNGLVIAHFGHRIIIERDNGEQFQCHLRRNKESPVVGDNVSFQPDGKEAGVVLSIAERRTVLQRGDEHGRLKPLAANVDVLVIVMAPPPILSLELVNRYTVACTLLDIKPLLVINKRDLMSQEEASTLMGQLESYQSIGCPVIFTSCRLTQGLDSLLNALQNKRAVLAGPSGVGKSSIIKALTASNTIQIGDVSEKGIGKHTTTVTRLYHLAGGGELIDSPGLRDFKVWSINKNELFRGFNELHEHAICRFKDCAHVKEPGCGVRGAVEAGKINIHRYEHYAKWRQTLDKNKRD